MNRRTFALGSLTLPILPGLLHAQTPEATPVANPNQRRVIAGSESSTSDELPADRLFGEWVGAGNKALHLPIAAPDAEARTPLKAERVWTAISQEGVTDLDIWMLADIEADGFEPDLSAYRGVYIGDGNPQMLLSGLHASGLFDALIKACDEGTVLYGTSAGTMVLGVNALLPTSPHQPGQTGLPPEETNGLDVIQAEDGTGLVLVPHFVGSRTHVWEPVAAATGYKAILIRDGNALTLNNGVLEEFGPDPLEWIG